MCFVTFANPAEREEERVGARVDVLVAVIHTMHRLTLVSWPHDQVAVGWWCAILRHEDSGHLFLARMVVATHVAVCSCRKSHSHIRAAFAKVLVSQIPHLTKGRHEGRHIFKHVAQVLQDLGIQVLPEVNTTALRLGRALFINKNTGTSGYGIAHDCLRVYLTMTTNSEKRMDL